ncbi:glycerate kinase type-2 family protein [Kosmotoga pacifica]|uniref:glycerate 2-kinase n=1 Tax=Kosmotoga pacifica TaxID=1330330 RepID=A0A0G2ZGB2_9BACT|nr:glycerate kinase [Kosmotoga pacifica]AKI97843.1 glycerate kinase [Kosmotoga pacifica]
MNSIREDALYISKESIKAVLPENAVISALEGVEFEGDIVLVAIGKAAWRMAAAAKETLGDKISRGVVITKYQHSLGEIEGLEVYEAGHPVPDENTLKATERAIKLVKDLTEKDTVLFLVSGGGSALFESLREGVTLDDLMDITQQLLKSGANIVEINMVRKHLSKVKGGGFARLVQPARVFSLVLSDVLGDRLDSIASGPAYPDSSTSEEALQVIEKYGIRIREELRNILMVETPKSLNNVETKIIGSVSRVCEVATEKAKELGYNTMILTTTLDCEAREAGAFLAAIARQIYEYNTPLKKPCAIILGGETVVHVKGTGKGGRNQELALSAAGGIKGLKDVAILSIGTDGTDGPTDAAGGIVDGTTVKRLKEKGLDIDAFLNNNDAYHALQVIGDLIKTGPTGTNVNDLLLLLVR